jgi:hypothetical protein
LLLTNALPTPLPPPYHITYLTTDLHAADLLVDLHCANNQRTTYLLVYLHSANLLTTNQLAAFLTTD